eukprot:4390-Lingulodinium_polyedra.AAC.1
MDVASAMVRKPNARPLDARANNWPAYGVREHARRGRGGETSPRPRHCATFHERRTTARWNGCS